MIGLSGRFRSALIIGGQGIRARKLRTMLSMVSLFLGVLAVVIVQAGASIAEKATIASSEMSEGKDGTVRMYVPSRAGSLDVVSDAVKGRADSVVTVSTSVIIGEPDVTPINAGGGPLDDGANVGSGSYVTCDGRGNCTEMGGEEAGTPPGAAVEMQLTAMTGDVRQFRPYRSTSGSWLDFGGAPSMSPRIVINKEAAKAFSRHRIPAEMRINGAPKNPTPRIIGVIDDGRREPAAYVRLDELRTWTPSLEPTGDSYVDVQLLMKPEAAALAQTVKARLVAAGANRDEISAEPIDARKQAESQLALMRWIFLGMAGLVLLIGVAGILNVGLATVGERVEEFALRRAVGTPRTLLAGIVLAETLLTGMLTAAAAIGAGVLGVKVVVLLFADKDPLLAGLVFPWQAGAAGIIAGLTAGVLGGLIPAIRAAGIPIATVMRA